MQLSLSDEKVISDNNSLPGTGPFSKLLLAIKGEVESFFWVCWVLIAFCLKYSTCESGEFWGHILSPLSVLGASQTSLRPASKPHLPPFYSHLWSFPPNETSPSPGKWERHTFKFSQLVDTGPSAGCILHPPSPSLWLHVQTALPKEAAEMPPSSCLPRHPSPPPSRESFFDLE